MVLRKIDRFMIIGIFLAISAVMLFGELAEDVWHRELLTFDAVTIHWLAGFSSPALSKFMIIITSFGSASVLVAVFLLTAILLWCRCKDRWDLFLLPVALGGGWAANVILKWIFHRPRPGIAQLVEAGGYSFPSGHAMVSISLYGFIAYLIWKNSHCFLWKRLAVLLLGMLILMIGISRIYLGVHYPSDVLAGFSAGMIWLLGCVMVSRIIGSR